VHAASLSKSTSSIYNIASDRTNRENLSLLGALPGAIARGELLVWHQAKLRLSTNEVAGSEVSELRERGYRVAIDDFGVGHSSLAYLQRMRASALKIDQAFIRTLAEDPNNQKIVRAILLLAKSLGLETVGEGIEDQASLSLLREWGCDYGQGYAIHRPAPEPEFRHFLQARMAAEFQLI